MTDHDEAAATGHGWPQPGQLAYLQVPATDARASAEFYARVFGWSVEHKFASFEAPGLIGQWVEGPAAPAGAGVTIWLAVDDMGATLELARASGGSVAEKPSPDGPRVLATIVDPAGNRVGVVARVG